jgi:heterodisulfide reductase subunit A2
MQGAFMKKHDKKMALFLCKCGTNIADMVDFDTIQRRFGATAAVSTHDLLCSPAGKKFMKESLAANKPDVVVVAACSPKMHEKTFQDVAAGAGINMARVHMANIREQCAWVTKDKNEATAKAIALINGALVRSVLHEDLDKRSMECLTDIVVIGGGIAGIEAALMAANAGRKVTIIEKEISVGGEVIKMEEVAPNMECAPCLLAPRISSVRDNPNITVVANAEVTDVIGFFGNFIVKALRKARYVKSSCIGCEACFEVCPVSAPSNFHLGLGTKKAIYTQFPGSLPATAVIDAKTCKHFIDGSCDACVAVCPFQSIDFNDKDEKIEITAGAVIVATGSGLLPMTSLPLFKRGRIANALTMPEFERIASSNGPYGGDIRLADGRPVNSLAVIHCAGSLTTEGVPYCSGICCMTAMKAGELLRKKNPKAAVVNIHDRMVMTGPDYDAFYKRQKHEGTKFVKTSDLTAVSVAQKGNSLEVRGPGFEPFSADMVVLATGSTPSPDMDALCKLLNTDRSSGGFFKPDHQILHATGTSIDGVYAVGGCASPCDISTAITRAQAAAGDAVSRLVPGRKIELETMTSAIDELKCGGCRLCIAVCPYKAVRYDRDKKVSVVNEAVCRGCGTCAAACPGGAIRAKHFADNQLFAEVEGVLHG